jgi:hypothetical protein
VPSKGLKKTTNNLVIKYKTLHTKNINEKYKALPNYHPLLDVTFHRILQNKKLDMLDNCKCFN